MNNRKNIELARKLSWISKREKKINPSMKKVFTNFFMENWKAKISTLFTLCSIAVPFSYLNYINSNYLFYDALSSFKAWIGAFILFSIIIILVLVIPLFFSSWYFFILKSKFRYIKDKNILVRFNNLFIITPIISIFLIITAYFYDYSSLQITNIFLIMVLGPSVLCLFYVFRLILFPKYPIECSIEEKTVCGILKSNVFKSACIIALSLLIFNSLFIIFYFILILSVLPKDFPEWLTIFIDWDNFLRLLNQLLNSTILILIYIASGLRHNFLIKNNKKLNSMHYLKESIMIILSAFLILLIVIKLMPEYPNFIFNPMRALGYIEDKRDARWYSIDNRFIEWNNFQALFLDKKIIYTQEQVCYKKDFDLSKLSKKEKIPFHLYGYMAWNTGNTRIFCPVSISIGKDVGSKCWHIPSQYINLIPKG
jgi:membrane protein